MELLDCIHILDIHFVDASVITKANIKDHRGNKARHVETSVSEDGAGNSCEVSLPWLSVP